MGTSAATRLEVVLLSLRRKIIPQARPHLALLSQETPTNKSTDGRRRLREDRGLVPLDSRRLGKSRRGAIPGSI
jgi:hypothetical protein